MKKHLLLIQINTAIGMCILALLLLYGVFSFVLMEGDVSRWAEGNRLGLVVSWIASCLIAIPSGSALGEELHKILNEDEKMD